MEAIENSFSSAFWLILGLGVGALALSFFEDDEGDDVEEIEVEPKRPVGRPKKKVVPIAAAPKIKLKAKKIIPAAPAEAGAA